MVIDGEEQPKTLFRLVKDTIPQDKPSNRSAAQAASCTFLLLATAFVQFVGRNCLILEFRWPCHLARREQQSVCGISHSLLADPVYSCLFDTCGVLSCSIIAFHDNSSAIRGCEAATLGPEQPGRPCRMIQRHPLHHPILTAETHNFPTGVAPFNGAE